MARKALHILVIVGLMQGIASAYAARQLWLDKIRLQEIVDAGSLHNVCAKLAERGL